MEAHLYPMGPHGIALGTEETQGIDQKYLAPYCESWMGLAIRWISEQLYYCNTIILPTALSWITQAVISLINCPHLECICPNAAAKVRCR